MLQKQLLLSVIIVLTLSGCVLSPGGVYRDTVDPVTGERTIQTYGVTFVEEAGLFAGTPTGASIGGRILGGRPQLIVSYNADGWLFMERAKFRFEDAQEVYTLNLSRPNREVGYGGSISETAILNANSGAAGRLLNEIRRRASSNQPSRLFIRLEGRDYYSTGVAYLSAGEQSFGGFFNSYLSN